MARSVVDSNSLESLKNSIETYAQNSSGSLSNFQSQANALLSQFEDKLSRLEEARDRAESALSSCRFRQRNSDYPVSCASEEAAYERACKRYNQCAELITQARSAIEDFVGKTESYNSAMSNLVSKATAGVMRVEEILNDYSSDGTNNIGSGLGDSLAMPYNSIEEAPPSQILPIPGADQIAYVLPKGSGTDPIVIDPEAMAHKFDGLPPVQAPDSQTMRFAAADILTLLAAGGLAVGSKEMLLQQKTDEIFEKQYGISRTELLIGSGPKQKEYIDAYNRIHQGLKQEMVEEKKRQFSDKLYSAQGELNRLQDKNRVNMESIGRSDQLRVDIENIQNQLATLEDGKKRPWKENKTYIAGLTEGQLAYLQDNGKMTTGRYGKVLLELSESNYHFEDQNPEVYVFRDGPTRLDIAHDGHYYRKVTADEGINCSGDFSPVKVEGSLSQDILSWESKEPSKLNSNHNISLGTGLSASMSGSCSAGISYSDEIVFLDEKGRSVSGGYDVSLGPEGHVELEGKADMSKVVYAPKNKAEKGALDSGIGIGGGGGVSVGKGGIKGSVSSQPYKCGDAICDLELQGEAGGNLGASIEGSYQFSQKGFEAKAGLSALLNASGGVKRGTTTLEELPPSIAERLENVPTRLDAVIENAVDGFTAMADAYAKADIRGPKW